MSPDKITSHNIPQTPYVEQLPSLPDLDVGCRADEVSPLTCAAYFDATPNHKFNQSDKALIAIADEQLRVERWERACRTRKRIEQKFHARRVESFQNRKFTVTINHDLVKVKSYSIEKRENCGGGIRGAVAGFSRASRKRLLEFMASIRWDMSKKTVFATLTYPGRYASVPAWNDEQWLSDFEALRRRIERLSDEIMIVWRKEFVRRKSGETKGILLPHYHLIILMPDSLDMLSAKLPDGTPLAEVEELKLNPDKRREHSHDSRLVEAWLLAHWHDIAGRGDDNHRIHGVHVSPVKSRRHVYHYVSKYIGKIETDKFEIGRRWGRVGKFDTSPLVITDMTPDEYIEFRRLVAHWMRARGGKYWRKFIRAPIDVGCTVFGLGDSSVPAWKSGFQSTIWSMLLHATGLISQKMVENRLDNYS